MAKYPHSIPTELTKHVSEGLRDAGRAWLFSVPSLIGHLEAAWNVRVGPPMPAGEFNFVAPASRADGESFIIKIAPPYPDGECYSEAAFLRHHDGRGCVRLIEQDHDARAMLLERAMPGLNLSEEFAGREDDAIGPAIEVLTAIQGPPPGQGIDVISLDNWFSNLERCPGTGFPLEYSRKALAFYEKLASGTQKVYLHGDFHPGNIVTATREPFLIIDPKGIVGSLGYDIAIFLNNLHWWLNDTPDLRLRLDAAVKRFADAFGMSEIELKQWAYAAQVLGAFWTFDEMRGIYSDEVLKSDIWDV